MDPRSIRARIVGEVYTCLAFWLTVSALPALAFSYIVVRFSKNLWLKILSSRYPNLEFIRTVTIRALLDTHRNQGIINVLLCVKGGLNEDAIRHQLAQHLIDRRDERGGLVFPRLRHVLVSTWGNYAWDANVPFRLENHFIVANGIHRGRPVSDSNIQEYVSDKISKYFPPDQPPWQYIIIPCVSLDPKYYVLVRVHHLLLTGKGSLNIGDMLLLEQTSNQVEDLDYYQKSPLGKLFPQPSAIPELWGKLNETMSNIWNEFISEYDPIESPCAMKSLPGAFHVAGIVLISAASALRELKKKRASNRDTHPTLTATKFIAAVKRECKKRSLNAPKLLLAPLVTVDPRKWPRKLFKTTVSTAYSIVTLPFKIRDELTALYDLRFKGEVKQMNTLTWKYGELGQLWIKATVETWRYLIEAYRAPAQLWSDAMRNDTGKQHMLQTISLCGRKAISWSKPISRASMERAARALGVTSTDIALYAATESLRAFFEQAQSDTPENVLVTARAATEDFLYTFSEGNGKRFKKDHTGGMVCLSLPIGASPRRIAAVIDEACKRQKGLAALWAAQTNCGALTRSVPSPFARLTLNMLSRRYAVSYAEINAPINGERKTTLWRQTVEDVLYWRPPQANISMSLTIIQYADTVRLAVMTDARLAPAHTVPSARWPAAVLQLLDRIERIAAQSQQEQQLTEQRVIEEQLTEPQETEPEPTERTFDSLRPPNVQAVSPPPTPQSADEFA
ncbi:uncharacterized protein LOC121727468 [Aricia agestis]|uniref:uncharacterized protein LOC121727468 n=1 Tax=Aricia agestis TaxID=91739 RepID=UPI001C20750C|nr:uncharacterized protein LOC121727468 [Aricia agestis]XP_041971277.1 uncharacterized protein LOC121727468 [Aricia agestis]XP_041971279.1 uncharacterized protein LOC121727468 [Aricia agestis]